MRRRMHHVRRSDRPRTARPLSGDQGQSQAACEPLARVHEWFTEDFDALNLNEMTGGKGGRQRSESNLL